MKDSYCENFTIKCNVCNGDWIEFMHSKDGYDNESIHAKCLDCGNIEEMKS